MKLTKFIYISSFIFLISFSNSAYAQQSDIQNIIFDSNLYNSKAETDIIFSSNKNIEPYPISFESKKDIDDIVEKALADASKQEEKRISLEKEEKRKKEEEKKKKNAEIEYEKKIEAEKERERKVQEERENSKNDSLKIEDIVPTKIEQKNTITEELKYELPTLSDNTQISQYAKSLLGVPYVYGGNSLKGLDCSSYVQTVYKKFNIKIPRTTFDQIKVGTSINLSDIKENDLIFFDTRSKKALMKNTKSPQSVSFEDILINESEVTKNKLYPTQPTHVGIYLGNGKFAHASSSKKKVVIEDMDNAYFSNRIVDIKRYI